MIIDYEVGNLLSLKHALENVGFNSIIGSKPLQLKDANTIVLPGVGNFSVASKNLVPFKTHIVEHVRSGMPILGICLGLQLFFPKSEEGNGRGLALFQGKNLRLPSSVKVPHMGWNTIRIIRRNKLFENVQDEAYVYFAHSCFPAPIKKDIICAETLYGTRFTSAVAKENIYGTQFHPEKSGKWGLKILKNFYSIVKR